MLNITEAIYKLYPNVTTICEDIAYDSNNNIVDYDLIAVTDFAKKAECKQQASELLYETDWTTISDVADPANSPYLTNQTEFIAWRNQIRALAVNPVADPIFPPKPDEIWG